MNITETVEGKIKSVDLAGLYRSQKLGTAAYRITLAEGLRNLGYELRIDGRTGAPEIAGISRDYIEASSPRQTEIKETAERMRAVGRQKGMVRADGSTSTRAAATHSRRSKVFEQDEMKLRHQELEVLHGGQARKAVEAARTHARALDVSLLHDEGESHARAQEAVAYAVARLDEHEPLNRANALLVQALERGLGETTLEEVKAEIERRYVRGELDGVADRDTVWRQLTTEKTLRAERANIEKMRGGQDSLAPICAGVPERLATAQGVALNDNQREAVEQIVTSRDRIQGLQGNAGTGKPAVLSAVKAEAERAGCIVQGFAPTTRAAQLLARSGIESGTLQKFIWENESGDGGRRLLVLDESSLASARQLNAFLSISLPQDRILLVGDVRRQEGVEATTPFTQLQYHGMQTARLEKIVRQRDEPPGRAVKGSAVGEVRSADEARQVNKSTAPEATHRLQQSIPAVKEFSDGQKGRAPTETGADRARESREAGATAAGAGRSLSAFDRGRIQESVARAVRDIGADTGNSTGRDQEGAREGARGVAGRERERESADRSATRRGAAGTDKHERASPQSGGGHPRQPDPAGSRNLGTENAAEQSSVAAGARTEERHAASDVDARHMVASDHVPSPPVSKRATDARRSSRTNELSTATPAEYQPLSGERAESQDGAARAAADVHENNLRAADRGVAGASNLPGRDDGFRGVAQPADGRRDSRGDRRPGDLDGGGLPQLAIEAKDALDFNSARRSVDDVPHSTSLHDLSIVDRNASRNQRVGALRESGRLSIADEVKGILDRPAQIERMAMEVVRLADENRLAQGMPSVDGQVQEYMRANLVQYAEHTPSPAQAERDRQIAQSLGEEDPHHENALQSSLYAARHATGRGALLERFTATAEAAYEREYAPAPAIEHGSQGRDDFSISR